MTPSPRRYVIVGVTAVAALWMYIDRVCVSTLADPIQTDLGLTEREKGLALGAFFYTYALFQVPVGSLADRFGRRAVLAACVVGWSVVTAATGVVGGFLGLLAIRLALGVSEAGAYPAAAGLVRQWALPAERGRFSSAVAVGGRVGATVAPFLTAFLAASLFAASAVGPSGVNWRGVFVFYGVCGLAVAVVFWLVVRDHPPGAAAQRGESLGPTPGALDRLARLAGSRNMWLYSGVQFGTNFGWAPLVTLLPTFLKEVYDVPIGDRGVMQSAALLAGCVGMVAGGFVTDAVNRRYGPRWGRAAPVAAALAGCAACLVTVPSLASAWSAVAVLGLMAFLVDLSNPSVWAFAQDVGGKNVGAALGWGNMWGNFGAALSPTVLTELRLHYGWGTAFTACAGAFLAAAVCGFLLDAGRPLADDQPGGHPASR